MKMKAPPRQAGGGVDRAAAASADGAPSRRTRAATLIGAAALLLWAALALLTTATGAVPPFQLTALTFAIAFLLAAAKWTAFGESPALYLRQPAAVWLVGVGGLFFYHALYFLALKVAPPV